MLTDVLDTQKLNQILFCFRLFFVVYKMFVVCSLFGVLCCLQNVCCLLFVRCSLLFVVVFNVRSKPLVNFHSRLSRRSMQTYAPTTMTTHQSGALSKAKECFSSHATIAETLRKKSGRYHPHQSYPKFAKFRSSVCANRKGL